MSKIMTLEEVAKYLKVDESTVYTWANNGTIPAAKLGRLWRFDKEEIDRWIKERSKQNQVR